MNVKSGIIFTFSLFFLSTLSSIDLNLRITPTLLIPIGDSRQNFSIGGSAFIDGELAIADSFSFGPEFSYNLLTLRGSTLYAQLIGGGLNSAMRFYPTSRLTAQFGASGGVYYGLINQSNYSSLYWRAYSGVGLRITPSLAISGEVGYFHFHEDTKPLSNGFNASISAIIALNNRKSSGKLELEFIEGEPVFPLFYSSYQMNSLGSIVLKNNETAEIRNIKISFYSENFTNSPVICGELPILRRGKSIEVPLFADFNKSLMNFTEAGNIPGVVTVSYSLLGSNQEFQESLVIPVYNRNNIRWYDPTSLAAFISPNAPEILDFSKFIVGLARNQLRTGLNKNMQFAMYLFEGLKTGGINYSPDEITPYIQFHKDASFLDYIQYPSQTLSYQIGDLDDLGLLYAALTESVGIKTALIPLENDFAVALSLGISSSQAEYLFNNLEELIIIDDEVWIPISFSKFNEGFINCWKEAANNLDQVFARGEMIDFIVLQDAWQFYPPSGLKDQGTPFVKPAENRVTKEVDIDLLRYINTEMGPKMDAIITEITEQGETEQRWNRLGLVYIRAGMYEDAERAFGRSNQMGSLSAKINLGNLLLLQEDYEKAIEWFNLALSVAPENNSARKGLEKAQLELLEK